MTLERLNLVVLKVRVIHPKCITTAISRIAKIDKLHQAKVVHGQTQGKKLKDIWGKIAGSLNLTWPSFLILLLLQQPFQSAINLHCVCLICHDTGWTGILDKNFRKGLDVVVIIVQYMLNCALIADVWFIRCPCRACHGKSTTFNEWQWLCKKQKICSQSKEVYCQCCCCHLVLVERSTSTLSCNVGQIMIDLIWTYSKKKSSTICALLTNQSMNLFLEGLRLLCGTLSSEGRVLRSPASKIEYITRLQLTSRLTKQSWREQHALQSPHQKSQNLSHTWNAKKSLIKYQHSRVILRNEGVKL